jgi:F-type H+-transporting ATPase subunit delta
MSESRSAYRYALAILEVAEETKQLDRVGEDLALIGNAIKESREFYLFLRSPIVNKDKKEHLLGEVFNGKICDLTMKFIILVTHKGRERHLIEIIREFNALRDQRLGIINVSVKTASTLTQDQRKRLVERIQTVTKKSVRLDETLEPQLIGGFTVQYEDTVWDGSVRRQLETLRERLIGGAA